MRIVAGSWRGRRIGAPRDDRVRPTGDRVREAWMSIVNSWLPGAKVLDLFAGSGALGLEALSRGADVVDFVEIAPASLAVLRANAESLEAGPAAVIHRADAVALCRGRSARTRMTSRSPTHRTATIRQHALAERWLEMPFADVLGIEHSATETLPGEGDRRRYGNTVITFYWSDR